MTFPLKVEIYFQASCPMENSFAYLLENTMVTIKTESTLVPLTFSTCCLLSGIHVFQIGGEYMNAIRGTHRFVICEWAYSNFFSWVILSLDFF